MFTERSSSSVVVIGREYNMEERRSNGVMERWSIGRARLPKDLSTIAKGFGFRRSFVRDADSRAEPGPGRAMTADPMSCRLVPASIQHAYTEMPRLPQWHIPGPHLRVNRRHRT